VQPVKHCVSPDGHAMQLPPMQLSPLEHTVPQLPQFLASLLVSVHTPLQVVWPKGQVQRLLTQCCPEPKVQDVPQLPQLRSSLVMSTQAPLQLVSWAEHEVTQVSCWQTPPSQTLPQKPQLFGSFKMFLHWPPQSWSKTPGHVQKLLLQICPPLQAKLHAPQLLMSLVVSTQLPLQSVDPEGQPNRHVPMEQESPAAHAIPQPPQLFGSVEVFTHLVPHWVWGGMHIGGVTQVWFWHTWPMAQQEPLQSTSPVEHLSVQLPDTHCWFCAQVRLQAPQFDPSVLVLTQTPLQLVRPAAQPVMQLPWLQKVPVPQACPQLPQFELSEDGSVQALLQKS
jgi:hypothetical protein